MAKRNPAFATLIAVFSCEVENIKTWEYYDAPEMLKIIEDSKTKNKKTNVKKNKRGGKC